MNTVNRFEKALGWIDRYSISGKGIAVNSKNMNPYPEVTGYYIPTLLAWGEKDRAYGYGNWLLTCQHEEGCWGDANENKPYAFDTGQIIKGLLALAKESKSDLWKDSISKACNWICDLIDDNGKPNVPDSLGWGGAVPLSIMLYALQAVKEAGEYYNESRWINSVDLSVNWFLAQEELTDFTHLSHFHAYVLEALCDLGYHKRAREGMIKVEKLQRNDGSVPGFPDVRWVCSTGLFQYAIIWYKLGDGVRGDRAFHYAANLQNRSGGWYGSYGWFAKYFPRAEIAWAVKYFLDALQWRLKVSFEQQSVIFSDFIEKDDGRYEFLRKFIHINAPEKILDAGCGKGRYLRNLVNDCSGLSFNGVDLSERVMNGIPSEINTRQGSLLAIPFNDSEFDLVYTVEALEHAVNVNGALKELMRVIKVGGSLIIIDKNIKKLGALKLPDWEQWFDTKKLTKTLSDLGCEVTVFENIPYEGRTDGLFTAWVAKKLK
jgi:malonyl-CoA O-methyltransferase